MLTQEQVMEIRILARQGKGIREIAGELGISRNTVRRYLRDSTSGRYARRASRPGKLAPYEVYLRERIAQAHPNWLPAPVMLRELKSQGYTGSLSLLKRRRANKCK
jgi:transposase